MRHVISAVRTTLTLLASLAPPLAAQCTNPWPTVPGSMGVEGSVSDMLVFDPDGAGPIGQRVLVSGSFQIAGTVLAQNLALYDPMARTWSPFGPGPHPTNLQLAVAANGDLYVGGNFVSIAGVAAANVARWDGTSWSALGSGVVGAVTHIAALPGGGIVVTGSITSAGGAPANRIARWDGSSWSSLGATSLPGTVSFGSVAGMPNGDICAAVQQSGVSPIFYGVLRFDGVTWSQLGGTFSSRPWKLLALPSGELISGGNSVPGDATQCVGLWNGTTWVVLAGAPFLDVWGLGVMPGGQFVALGRSSFNTDLRVALWDGLNWVTLGDGQASSGTTLEIVGGEVLVGGAFGSFAGVAVGRVARWNGSTWSSASPGLVGSMRWLAVRPDGGVFAGAAFGAPGEGLVHRWTGLAWSQLGGGSSGTNLTGLFAVPSGGVIAGVQVSSNQGLPVPIVQEWSGSSWTTLATAAFGTVKAAAELPNGDLVVGGQFVELSGVSATNVARFDGTSWSPMGAGLAQIVNALVASPSGDLFALAGFSVLRWNGSAWQQIGLSHPIAPKALVIGNDGAPVVAGSFTGADVLRWNGVSWAPLGTGPVGSVQSLVVLPNGDLVAGPVVESGNPRSLERWDGSSWSPLGGTVDATVWSMAIASNGDVLLSGDFSIADSVVRCRFARVSTSCPASVVTVPSGCVFPTPVLTTQTLPWIGGTCVTTTTGFTADAIAVVATGLQETALPLGTLLSVPAGSCMLLVVPIILDLHIPAAGRIEAQFAVPDSTAMIGTPVRQQVVSLSIDAGGSITSAKATNALVFQIGSF